MVYSHQQGVYSLLPKRADFATVPLGFWGRLRAEVTGVETMAVRRTPERLSGGRLDVRPDPGAKPFASRGLAIAPYSVAAIADLDSGGRAGQAAVRPGDMAVAAGW
jgi:hypothetical protein